MIFETHCHLNDDAFKEDLEETLKRAKENYVTSLCVIGWDKDSSINAVRICKEYKNMGLNLYAAVGLHPENVKDEKDKELNWLIDLINEEEVCAIGEIGIDLHFEKDTLDR